MMQEREIQESKSESLRLKELFFFFFQLGTTGFGGPAVLISMMRSELIKKRKWFTDEHFLDMMGAMNLLPGPNVVKLAMNIGKEYAGYRGLVVSGFSYIIPSILIVLFFAWLYQEYGSLPAVQPYIEGIKSSIVAVILVAIYPLAKTSVKSAQLGVMGIVSFVLCFMGVREIYVMFGMGLLAMAIYAIRNKYYTNASLFLIPLISIPSVVQTNHSPLTLPELFFIFLKIGSMLYGSGYVLFAFLDSELVANSIISKQVLIDAITVGQFTPGPLFSSVTFIGYYLHGFSGALVVSVAAFLPSFLLVVIFNPLIPKLRASKILSEFLNAVNIASIAVMFLVCYQLSVEVMTNIHSILIFGICFATLFFYENNMIVILLGAVLGYCFSLL